MKNNNLYVLLISVAFLLLLSVQSCKPDDHDHDHDHDAVTRVAVSFVDTSGSNAAGTFSWSDPDGIGGNPPTVIDTIRLSAGKVYKASVMFFAAHDGHEDNITPAIVAEKEDHLLVFKNITANISVAVLDKDNNNFPVGLESLWTAGAISSGSLNLVLKHQPGVKDGTEAPGDTDVDVTYPVLIQ